MPGRSAPSLRELQRQQDKEAGVKPKSFKDYKPGFVHVDVNYRPQMADETRHKYLFVGIDRATHWSTSKPCQTKARGNYPAQ